MGRMVPIGQEEQGVVTGPVFRTTVTAPMPSDVPLWVWIFLAVIGLVVISRR